MLTHELTTASAAGARQRLELLERERAAAGLHGLAGNRAYTENLLEERDAVRHAYVGAAVTEIATLRAALGGPLFG